MNCLYLCLLQVYFYLLKMYLDPPSPSTLGLSASQGIVPKPNMTAALQLMREHAPKIDTSKVCFDMKRDCLNKPNFLLSVKKKDSLLTKFVRSPESLR